MRRRYAVSNFDERAEDHDGICSEGIGRDEGCEKELIKFFLYHYAHCYNAYPGVGK
jgi:hypothetical protein